MKKWRILISAPYMLPVVERFRPDLEARGAEIIIANVEERLEAEDLLALISDIDGIICGDDRFTPEVLAAAPQLKVISKWGTGIDSIDKVACQQYGIEIRNTPNAFSEPVADSVLGYMLSFARNLPFMDQAMKAGTWQKIPGRALRECTLGVVGVGNVGKAVIRRAHAFGMTILGNDPQLPAQTFLDTYAVQMVDLSDLLSTADFVSINCDLNPTSKHLINAETLRQMKPNAILINTARGPIVQEDALEAALEAGTIGGAALDVFEHEPLPVESRLRNLNNVMIAPHNSNSSPEAWEHVHLNTINNLFDVLERATN
jgi:D-3-phosphoglycerate dehydrogenase / 2-oxoglutarate reductase